MMFRLLVQHLFFLILRARNQLHPMSARKTNKKPSDNSSYADIVETMEVERVTASVDAISHESKSRFRGVVKSGSRFKAEVIVNGVKHVLGEFDTEIEAAKSYDSYAKSRAGGSNLTSNQQNINSGVNVNKRARLDESVPLERPSPIPIPVNGSEATTQRTASFRSNESVNSSAPVSRSSAVEAALSVPSGPVPSPSAADDQLRQKYWQQMQQQHEQQQRQLQHQRYLLHQQHQQQQQSLYASKAPTPVPHTVPIMGTTVHAGVPLVYIPVPMPIAPGIMQTVNEYYAQQQEYSRRSSQAQQAQYASALAARRGYQPSSGSGSNSPQQAAGNGAYQHPAMSASSLGYGGGSNGAAQAGRWSPEVAAQQASNVYAQRHAASGGAGNGSASNSVASSAARMRDGSADALAATFAKAQRTTAAEDARRRRAGSAALSAVASAQSDDDSDSDGDEKSPRGFTAAARGGTAASGDNNEDEESDEEAEAETEEIGAESELNWRDQRFYWSGTLAFDTAKQAQVWKGVWAGSYSGRPSAEDFAAASDNTFEFLSSKIRKSSSPMTALDDSLMPQSGYFKGYYNMDNDHTGNIRKYADKDCVVVFEAVNPAESPPHQFVAYGRGSSEFGGYVLCGKFSNRTNVFESIRQYVAADDERASMTLKQLKAHFEKVGEFK